jgi:hypothetical protein
LVTNAVRKKPPQRHQLDHTIHRAKLRSVEITAAVKENSFVRSVDATAANLSDGEVPAVKRTDATSTAAPDDCSARLFVRLTGDLGGEQKIISARFAVVRPRTRCALQGSAM